MIILPALFLIIICIFVVQDRHYDFCLSKYECEELEIIEKKFRLQLSDLEEHIEESLKEFEEYKKKVDALVIKNGFRL